MAPWNVADSAERIVYRVAGLPVAFRQLLGRPEGGETDLLGTAFAASYWNPKA